MSFQKKIEHFILKYLAVPKTPKYLEGKRHIACIGDSITFGAGVNGKKEETWEHFLNHRLGDDFQVLNYGISGRTLQDGGDYPYKADKFYAISKSHPIDTYLIMLGTNDAKPYNWNEQRYRSQLRRFLNEYKQLPWHPQVIVMTPPHCFIDKKSGIVLFDIDERNIDGPIQEIVKGECKTASLKLIDLYAYTTDKEDWFADGVHPNKKGNEEIAAYIFRQLEIFHSTI